MADIDYRALLVRYMAGVIAEEASAMIGDDLSPKDKEELSLIEREARALAQASAIVGSVRERQHAQCERHRRAAAAASCRATEVVGIAGRTVNGIVGMGAQSELGRIGLANEYCSCAAQALDHAHARALRPGR